MAIASQTKWLDTEGGGRLALVLHWRWLTEGLATLLSRLEVLDQPVALALADPNDPLQHPGAVRGLATVAGATADLMMLRTDMGALGAIAHGATAAAIGTGTSVRHFVPTDQRPGGGRTGVPNVFVERLLDFRNCELLAGLPARFRPTCALNCCHGAPLDRFLLTHDVAGARVHNLCSLAGVADQLLDVAGPHRPALWKAMTLEAAVAAQRIAMGSGRPFDVRRQIAAWASL
jgi:hypothetical protein